MSMAKDTDLEQLIVLSKVKKGLKREFAFAMKAQYDMCSSLGRTRSRNVVQDLNYYTSKKSRKSDSVESKNDSFTTFRINDKDVTNILSEDAGSGVVKLEDPRNQIGATKYFRRKEHNSDVMVDQLKGGKVLEKVKKGVVNEISKPICESRVQEGDICTPKGGGDVGEVVSTLDDVECLDKLQRSLMHSIIKKNSDGDDKVSNVEIHKRAKKNVESDSSITNLNPMRICNASIGKFSIKLKDLLASGILEGSPVTYVRGMKERATKLQGVLSSNGIVCHCEVCKGVEVVTPTAFEIHAGSSNKRPSEFIFLNDENNLRDVMHMSLTVPLHDLEESLQKVLAGFTMKKSKFCVLCKDVNVVSKLLCNSCIRLPSTTQTVESNNNHASQVIQPRSSKSALSKSSNKEVKHNISRGESQGRHTKKDLRLHKLVFNNSVLEDGTELTYRDHGKVSPSQFEAHAGFASRRKPGKHFSKIFGPQIVIICDQELPEGNWFCCRSCDQIHTTLMNLVTHGEKSLSKSQVSLIRKKKEGRSLESKIGFDIKWRVLNWKWNDSDETRELLSKAIAIFYERFDPIIDPATSQDIINPMVYGGSCEGQEFGGMYCAVLTVNEVVVSAGIFRVFGQEVAELPLVATTADYQGQGYFKSLFSCIEDLLRSLKIKNFVLPAADEAKSIWTSRFGFVELNQDEINNYKRYYSIMMFQGTSLLHKLVPAP
ncbi:hypothetical protein RJT34_29800 [Clitoria ternatea]|uniref:N-acetyltransferase domain-containing protein n=1 Tax=Clitoria ternatea TaxID=43366 RepID=A0AAN9I1G2_CLITE